MQEIMIGEATPAQFGAFVTALRLKGETVDEISGLARTMRAKAVSVKTSGLVVDTCGTGGDGAGTFNISTTAAFIVAAAGELKVAKHGNRAMSSQCGSADVMEVLGVKINLSAEKVAQCLEEVSICFMFAPLFHPAMKYAAAPRRELGIRTVFNILGPLTNPADASAQLLGVANSSLLKKLARVLDELGCKHALVVHSQDGLDEITVCGKTDVCELKDGAINCYSISPEDFGLYEAAPDSLKGGNTNENATLLRQILGGMLGPQRDAVVVNAAAALLAADKVKTLIEGATLAQQLIDSGQALAKLDRLIEFSQSL
jgi:anthranilate phosphoribosyltransferase